MLIGPSFRSVSHRAPTSRQAARFRGSETTKKNENNDQTDFNFLKFPKLKNLTKEIMGAFEDMFDSSDTASSSNKISPETFSLLQQKKNNNPSYDSFSSQEKEKTD